MLLRIFVGGLIILWILCYGLCLIWIQDCLFWSDGGLYYVYFDSENIIFGYAERFHISLSF